MAKLEIKELKPSGKQIVAKAISDLSNTDLSNSEFNSLLQKKIQLFRDDIINNSLYTNSVEGTIAIDTSKQFANRPDLFEYIEKCLQGQTLTEGIANWIVVVYFEQFLPPLDSKERKQAKRRIMAEERYLLKATAYRRNRHHVYLPYLLWEAYKDIEYIRKFIGYRPMYLGLGDLFETWAGRQEVAWNRTATESLAVLYINDDGTPKAGSGLKEETKMKGKIKYNKGVPRRFGKYLQELLQTHCVEDMTAEYLLSILPKEFEQWKPTVDS